MANIISIVPFVGLSIRLGCRARSRTRLCRGGGSLQSAQQRCSIKRVCLHFLASHGHLQLQMGCFQPGDKHTNNNARRSNEMGSAKSEDPKRYGSTSVEKKEQGAGEHSPRTRHAPRYSRSKVEHRSKLKTRIRAQPIELATSVQLQFALSRDAATESLLLEGCEGRVPDDVDVVVFS